MTECRELEQIKLELSARLEEYKALRAEIVATLSSARSAAGLTITGTGILLAGAPFIVQHRVPYVFLLASYGFCFIAWTQLRCGQAVFNLSEHIIRVVAPGVRKGLTAMGAIPHDTFRDVLSWEKSGRKLTHPEASWSMPIEAARYILPLFAAVTAAIAYLVNGLQLPRAEWWETPLLWSGFGSSILLFLYSAFLTFRLRSQLRGAELR